MDDGSLLRKNRRRSKGQRGRTGRYPVNGDAVHRSRQAGQRKGNGFGRRLMGLSATHLANGLMRWRQNRGGDLENETKRRQSPQPLTADQVRLKNASNEAYRRFRDETDPVLRRLLFAEFERASNAFMESIKNG